MNSTIDPGSFILLLIFGFFAIIGWSHFVDIIAKLINKKGKAK